MADRVLPSNADYRKVLPLAVESTSQRRTFFPSNGATFTSDGNNIIRIDISGDAFLDPKHSYLKFRFTNGSGQTFGPDFGGGHSFIRRMRLEQAGNILSDTNQYNKLVSAILLPAQGDANTNAHRSITEATRCSNDGAAGASTAPTPAADISGSTIAGCSTQSDVLMINGQAWEFTIPLINGLLGTTQDKMVPLQLLGSSPITIELELAPLLDVGAFGGLPPPGSNYTLSNVRYIAQMVEVPPVVNAQLRMVQELSGGKLVLNGTDFTHFNANIAAAAAGMVSLNVPARRKSMKSLFFVGASQTYGAVVNHEAGFNLSWGGNLGLTNYQLKIGSVMIPPTPVQCDFNLATGPHFTRGEALMELKKCFGTISSTEGCGLLSNMNYMNTPGINAGMPVPSPGGAVETSYSFAPFGIDLESFQRTAIESGINTSSRATPITLLLNVGAANAEAQNIDAYVAYDSLYYIDESGSIRVSL